MTFSLHSYLSDLKARGESEAFIAKIRGHLTPLLQKALPPLLTPGQLAFAVNKPYVFITEIVKRRLDPYNVFYIKKRNGGWRYICAPDAGLLYIQRWIHDQILLSPAVTSEISPQATAYKPHSSHLKNARPHLGAKCIIKIDITRFFESISERQVYRIFNGLGYRPLIAFILTRLCTRIVPAAEDMRAYRKTPRWQTGKDRKIFNSDVVGHLPQGAPTSPMLANLVCRELDKNLEKIALVEGLVYTRYADDMTFSCGLYDRDQVKRVIKQVSAQVGDFGFSVNSRKTSVSKTGGRKIVTGISVEESELRLPRVYKDKIRQELYYLERFGLASHCSKLKAKNHFTYLMRLNGKIRYAAAVEPRFGMRALAAFAKLFPKYDDLEKLVVCP